MKTEVKVLIYSMINNLIISILKISGGFILGLSSLFADGLHTFSDFLTDIVSMIGTKVSKKRPTKYHPFGFGKIEYLTNLFTGVILFLLGIYIIVNSFGKEAEIPPLSLLILLAFAIVLKLIAILVMHTVGKKINSQVLITSVDESKTDLISSIGVVIITIVLQFSNKYPFLKYIDMIGSILIGLFVLKIAISIILENSLALIGETDNNEEEINKIKEYLKEFKSIEKEEITLIKYGSYNKLQLVLELDSKLSLRQVTRIENKIRTGILKHRSLNVKYVTIYVADKI